MNRPLTNDEIRLTAVAAIVLRDGGEVEYQTQFGTWMPTSTVDFRLPHRPKPKPVTRPWNCAQDVPGPVCWIRYNEGNILHIQPAMVTALSPDGVYFHGGWKQWRDLRFCEYSTDRINWKPCTVTESK